MRSSSQPVSSMSSVFSSKLQLKVTLLLSLSQSRSMDCYSSRRIYVMLSHKLSIKSSLLILNNRQIYLSYWSTKMHLHIRRRKRWREKVGENKENHHRQRQRCIPLLADILLPSKMRNKFMHKEKSSFHKPRTSVTSAVYLAHSRAAL